MPITGLKSAFKQGSEEHEQSPDKSIRRASVRSPICGRIPSYETPSKSGKRYGWDYNAKHRSPSHIFSYFLSECSSKVATGKDWPEPISWKKTVAMGSGTLTISEPARLALALLVQEKKHRHWSVAACKATLARL